VGDVRSSSRPREGRSEPRRPRSSAGFPNLVGQGLRTAESSSADGGSLPVDEAHGVFSGEVPEGLVQAQVPRGKPAVPGGACTARVGWAGRREVGDARLERTDARRSERWIDTCGFRRGPVPDRRDRRRRPGTVRRELPLSGYPIQSRGVVELSVAK